MVIFLGFLICLNVRISQFINSKIIMAVGAEGGIQKMLLTGVSIDDTI
jgi:hypothetical protein